MKNSTFVAKTHTKMAIREKLANYWEKVRHTYYRLMILNNDTFEEISSYKLSLFSFYVLVSSLLTGVALVVVLLIVFTPLKRYIPGYEASSGGVMEVADRVEDLEHELKARQTYIDNFRSMLTENVQTEADMPKEQELGFPDSLLHAERSSADDSLRTAMEDGELFDAHDHEHGEAGGSGGGSSASVNISPSRPLQQLYLVPPVSGEVSLQFSPQKRHFGVDVVAPLNTPIKSVMDGFVISSDWTMETGNTIAVQHNDGVVTFYKHNSTLLKKTGDRVRAGEAIAIIGNTGEQTSGPHLHFEIWVNGKPVNPIDYVQF